MNKLQNHIIGMGSDLIDIRRIEKTLNKYGDRFTQRVFTEIERNKSDNRRLRAESYAKRYAAKEAMAKALGTGFRNGVYWSDIGVVNDDNGKPTIALTGGAAKRLAEITPLYFIAVVHLTITDEYPLAQAQVLIQVYEDPNAVSNQGGV